MRGEQESILITPPTGSDQLDDAGAADLAQAKNQPFTTTSSGVITLVGSGYITFTTDQHCRLRFWKTGAGSSMPVANQNDFPLWQYTYLERWIDGWLTMRVIGISGAGTLYWYPSSR